MKKNIFLISFSLIVASISCKNKSGDPIKNEHLQLNEDSLELVLTYSMQDKIDVSVYPTIETDPISANSLDDAADDPAIWYNRKDPSQSLIFGSNKMGGISVTNLQGEEIKYYNTGKINNIDILNEFPFQDTTYTILGCSNRTSQSINLYLISGNGDLIELNHQSYKMDSLKIDDIYGFCFGVDQNLNKFYVFINGKNGLLQQFEMGWNKAFELNLSLKRELQFDSQTEGMVCHNKSGTLYVGEEDKGIWFTPINPEVSTKKFVRGSDETNKNIKYDIEGITIYSSGEKDFLIASSQGNFTYAVFDILDNNRYLGSFKIEEKDHIDGVEETDGLDVMSDSLNVLFPEGILVVQDGFNSNKDSLVAQNFKYIDNRELKSIVDEFLIQKKKI